MNHTVRWGEKNSIENEDFKCSFNNETNTKLYSKHQKQVNPKFMVNLQHFV